MDENLIRDLLSRMQRIEDTMGDMRERVVSIETHLSGRRGIWRAAREWLGWVAAAALVAVETWKHWPV